MHNQHAGLSQQVAAQRISERHEQAAQARLAHSAGRPRRPRRRRLTRRWWQLARRPGAATQPAVRHHTPSVDRSEAPLSKLTRILTVAAMLAALHLAGIATVAHAQATDQQATPRPPTERQVGESWRHRQPASQQQQTAADATLQRVQARERFSIPNQTPARVPAPVQPDQPSGQPTWLVVSLGGLAAALAVVAGLALLAARRANRRARVGHAT
jgi:hypothetical protein